MVGRSLRSLCSLAVLVPGLLFAEAQTNPSVKAADKENSAKPSAAKPGKSENEKSSDSARDDDHFLKFSKEELAEARIAIRKQQLIAELLQAHKYALDRKKRTLLSELKALAPKSGEYQYFLALHYNEAGEKARALLSLEEATYRRPDFARAWNFKGILLGDAGRLPEARVAFEKASRISPYDPNYMYNLAYTHYRLREKTKAMEAARRAIQLKPNLAEGYYLQGVILRDDGQDGAAMLALEQAERFGMDSDEFWLDYLLVAESAKKEKKLVEIADDLAKSDDARIQRELARIHFNYGEFKKATFQLGRLLQKPEARDRDRDNYVLAGLRAGQDVPGLIRALRVNGAEKTRLMELWRKLRGQSPSEDLDTRDPVIKSRY